MTYGVEINLPRNLEGWTYETIVDIVRKYEFEPGIFDYKAVLNATNRDHRNDHNASIRRTAGSMANADGGFILFGVRDRSLSASSSDERITGMPLGDDLRKSFADKLSPFQRSIYFEASPRPIVMPSDSSQGIFVIYIPQSSLRPHMDESTGIFYRRGEGGKAEIMKFYEVREQMIYTEDRLQKVTLLRLEIAQYQEIIAAMLAVGPYIVVTRYRFDTGAFKILLVDICGLLPPSTDILRTLLKIPLHATIINQSVLNAAYANEQDVMAEPASFAGAANGIKKNLAVLLELCTLCETHLNEIFGPLEDINK